MNIQKLDRALGRLERAADDLPEVAAKIHEAMSHVVESDPTEGVRSRFVTLYKTLNDLETTLQATIDGVMDEIREDA